MPAARSRLVRPFVLALAAGAALATAACTGSEDPAPGGTTASSSPAATTASASPTASESPSASASPTESAAEGADFTMEEKVSEGWPELGPDLGTGTTVRVGAHDGYDRVVYEFSGPGVPRYKVGYVDEPRDNVSGDAVDVPGDSYLSVQVVSVGYPEADATPPTDPSDSSLAATSVTYAPVIWGGFEGHGDQFIGLRGPERPFRVTTLADPTRLVVDIEK